MSSKGEVSQDYTLGRGGGGGERGNFTLEVRGRGGKGEVRDTLGEGEER